MRIGWLLLVLGVAACARSSRPLPEQTADDLVASSRFPHGEHTEVPCADCHAAAAAGPGTLRRPGSADHAPCDREQCHREAFAQPPSLFCGGCHDSVDPAGVKPTTLAPYPPQYGPRALAAQFSHALHLDYARMDAAVGFHVSCTDCHTGDRTRRALPGHAACARCHAAEAGLADGPSMDTCMDCHRERPRRPARRRLYITGDLRFSHDRHEADRTGAPIACATCHTEIASIKEIGNHGAPATATCVACHDDERRTPASARMRSCEACHVARDSNFGTLAPRSHLPASETPEDHTLAFRSDHAIEARAHSTDCARCHMQMSGSTRDTCDQCHRSMEPRDHTVGWREYDHGPAASVDRDRCGTCHDAGFCIACHSRPPRSHFPRAEFSRGGHSALADLNLRACLVCHGDVQRDCSGAGCHTRDAARRGR